MAINAVEKIRTVKKLGAGIWRYNVSSKFSELAPWGLMVNLTYRCNSHCVMCGIWKMKPEKEMSTADWLGVMKDPIFKNIRTVTITGGEAFLYQEYVEVVLAFIDSMPKMRRLILNTNGFLPDRIADCVAQIAKQCKARQIKLEVSVSIDGVGEIHDQIRGTKDGFKKVCETLTKLKKLQRKYQFNLGAASLLMKTNLENFEETDSWLNNQKIAYGYQLVGFHETFVNNIDSEKSLGFALKTKEKLIKILEQLKQRGGWKSPIPYYWEDMIEMYKSGRDRTSPCPFLKDEFVIDGLGDVYYCLSVKPIGNLIKEKKTVSQIYFDPKNISFRKSLIKTSCKKCNSGCNAVGSLTYDFKKLLWFKVTGKIWPWGM